MLLHHVSTARSGDDIVLFGRDAEGRSLAFFAPLRPVVYFRGDVDALRKVYSAFVASRCRGKNPNFLQPLEIDTVCGQSLSEWNYDGLYSVHRLRCEDVKQYWTLRRLFRSKSFRCTEYFHRSEERVSCHDDGEFLRGGHWQLYTKEVNLFGLTIYNDQVSILVQWFVERGLRQNSVFAIEATPCAGAPRTQCAAEFSLESIAAVENVTFDFGLIKIASYDIEVLPRNYPEFPSAEKGDPIINISVSVSDGSDVSFCVGSTAPGSGVRCYRSETQMLVAFNQYLRRLDPDAIAGHNILKFDNIYFAKRCEELEVDNFNWSRFLGQKTKLRTFMNVEKMDIPGRFYVDTYPIFMQDHNLMSYKLDALAEHFLKSKKLDMPYSEINGAFATEEGRTKLCDYCQQDARLPLRLIEHGGKLAAAMALGKTAGCGADVILSRGQTIRILVLLHYYCREASPRIFIKSNSEAADDAETYEGAYVVDPKAGFYVAPIICVDFASLYPTIMMAYNISPDVKVSQQVIEIQDFQEGVDVDTMPDLVFEGDAMTQRINKKKPAFMSRDRRKGIFPQILEDLFKRRKELKKMMKAAAKAGDAVAKLNYNVAQLACKLLMNSFYGFLGFTSSPLYDRDLAAAVTGYGQQLTRSTVWFVEKKLRLQAIYGDSVIGSTPLMLRIDGNIVIRRIETLATKWSAYRNGKESCELRGVESWTEKGWTPVERVIRHVCTKKLVQVHTHTGNVVCTTDHSLVRTSGEEVAPKDLATGDSLLHHCVAEFPERNHTWTVGFDRVLTGPNGQTYHSLKEAAADLSVHVSNVARTCTWSYPNKTICYTPQFARLLGMFVGDGSCGNYNTTSGKKSSWAINNADKEMLNEYKTIAQHIFPSFEWKILPTLESSGVFKLVPSSSKYGNIARFVEFWRNISYNEKSEKKMHDCVLQSSETHRQEFWRGLHDADGTKKGSPEISQKGTEISLSIVMLLRSLGWEHVVVDARADKPDIFRMRARHKTRKSPDRVRKITDWNRVETFVYDLTTENHHFHAGIGTMIVHNTDSVFILADHMRGKTIEEIHAYGEEVAAQITTMFPKPVLMEYEKVYFGGVVDGVERGSYILVTKKRYAGRCVEEGSTKEKTDIKGLACKRRDRCKLVITAQKTLIEHFLNGRIDDGVAYARGILERLCRGDATVEELTITKALSKDPLKFAQNSMTHVFLAQRLARSTKHETPQKNDRISFLIRTGREKLYMRGVLPSEVGNCVLDRGYYLNNQLKPAFMEILNLVVPDRAAAVFQGLPISTVGTGPINSFFKPVGTKRAAKQAPPRTIVAKKVKTLKKGDISQYFKKQE